MNHDDDDGVAGGKLVPISKLGKFFITLCATTVMFLIQIIMYLFIHHTFTYSQLSAWAMPPHLVLYLAMKL